ILGLHAYVKEGLPQSAIAFLAMTGCRSRLLLPSGLHPKSSTQAGAITGWGLILKSALSKKNQHYEIKDFYISHDISRRREILP
ncbi:MAG: hypothetical protein L3J79_01930, partial [Candidatus Marinimicrobia bacterium]|nr:hypothetical protein [Candidatus Neomarinimicrobiota bacterium]